MTPPATSPPDAGPPPPCNLQPPPRRGSGLPPLLLQGRVSQFTYDLAGQKLAEPRGAGTPPQQTYATYAYTPNGKDWVQDAGGGRTDYTHDGFDRLGRTDFPNPSTGLPRPSGVGKVSDGGSTCSPSRLMSRAGSNVSELMSGGAGFSSQMMIAGVHAG